MYTPATFCRALRRLIFATLLVSLSSGFFVSFWRSPLNGEVYFRPFYPVLEPSIDEEASLSSPPLNVSDGSSFTSMVNYGVKARTLLAYCGRPRYSRSENSAGEFGMFRGDPPSFFGRQPPRHLSRTPTPCRINDLDKSTFEVHLRFREDIELLHNADVEEGLSRPFGWRVWPPGSSSASWTMEDSYSPVHSLKIELETSCSVSWYSDVFPVEEGRTYRFSGFFKGVIYGGRWHLSILWYKDRDKTGYLGYSTILLRGSMEWYSVSAEAVAPEEARYADLEFWAEDGVGVMYGDNFSVRDVSRILNVEAGSCGRVSFKVEGINGYHGTVNITVLEKSNGDLRFSVSPDSGKPPFNGVIEVYADSEAEGEYAVKLVATDGVTEKTVEFRVRVPYFTIEIEHSALVAVNGSTVKTEVYVTAHYGFEEPVSIDVSDAPSYIKCKVEPSGAVYGTSVRRVIFKVSGSAPFRTCVVTVTAKSGVKTKSAKLKFAVVFLRVKVTVGELRDEYGYPMVNPDGTYYPGDGFNLTVETSSKNLMFKELRFNFPDRFLDGPSLSETPNCTCTFTIKKNASPGTFKLYVHALAVPKGLGESVWIEASVNISLEVASYSPQFKVLTEYVKPLDSGSSMFELPVAAIIRYDGNGPEKDLGKRALITGDFAWSGYASKSVEAGSLLTFTPWLRTATFTVVAPEEFQNLTEYKILEINGEEYRVSDLPLMISLTRNLTYEWVKKVPSLEHPDVWYTFRGCIRGWGRRGVLKPTLAGQVVTAVYLPEKDIKSFPRGDKALTLIGHWPILLTGECRYAEITVKIDGELAGRIAEEGWNQISITINLTDQRFTQPSKVILSFNYTIYRAFLT